MRYKLVTNEKAGGATYTPKILADFVADEITKLMEIHDRTAPLRILDPAVGDGELLSSLLARLPASESVEIYGFDTNENAVNATRDRLIRERPSAFLHIEAGDFLEFALNQASPSIEPSLFAGNSFQTFDLIIANPPYVRIQILGAEYAQLLAKQFGLAGRVDLYHAFILGISAVLSPHGVAGIIVSNRFMTTKAGAAVRKAVRRSLSLRHVWDFGDTKIFNAAVLPAVLLAAGRNGDCILESHFTSIYETHTPTNCERGSIIDALQVDGVVAIPDGRRFNVRHGLLNDSDIWRVATDAGDEWLRAVDAHTWRTFGDVGKIRVGVKTCGDDVFIRKNWNGEVEAELLRPVLTHHIAAQFRADMAKSQRQILYPHETCDGKRRAVDLANYPHAASYLERHRKTLEARTYVLEAGRRWYEIWVPQDPDEWRRAKLVFRDIVEKPCFWLDLEGAVVNGDCYWMTCHRDQDEELLWLAVAVGNSKFIESFYDHRFNNKLYSGRRRFITQYVEKFPLPDPASPFGKLIIQKAKTAYQTTAIGDRNRLAGEISDLVWKAFGLPIEKIGG